MGKLSLAASVGDLVAENERRTSVLAKYGIDFCCGGKLSLEEACRRRGLDGEAVLAELAALEAPQPATTASLEQGTIASVVEHLLATHHAYLKETMPRLGELVGKVRRVHGENHPELQEVATVYERFCREMTAHLDKEERVLFPLCLRLADDPDTLGVPVSFVNQPLAVMESEHVEAHRDLARLRELTSGFEPPAGACTSYRAMMQGLADLEADTLSHIDKENGVLFAKVRRQIEAVPAR